MNRVLGATAALAAVLMMSGAAFADDMTLAGAQVMLTEIPGATDCIEPAAPTIPDGASVTEEAMMAGISSFKAYDEVAVKDYQECLNEAEKNLRGSATEQQKQAVTLVYDALTEKVKVLGDQLNEQIRAFNAANPS